MVGGCSGGPKKKLVEFVVVVGEEFEDEVGLIAKTE
jgi:hypothetical protein